MSSQIQNTQFLLIEKTQIKISQKLEGAWQDRVNTNYYASIERELGFMYYSGRFAEDVILN